LYWWCLPKQLQHARWLVAAHLSASMSNADFQRVVPEKLYSAIADAFFYGFHIVSKDLTMSSALFIVGLAVQFVQMLYFPVALLLNAGAFGDVLATILRISALVKIDTDIGTTGMLVLSIVVSCVTHSRCICGKC